MLRAESLLRVVNMVSATACSQLEIGRAPATAVTSFCLTERAARVSGFTQILLCILRAFLCMITLKVVLYE